MRIGFKQLKRQSFSQKIKISELLFEKATILKELKKFNEAIELYVQSLSVFTELKQNKKWEECTIEDFQLQKYSQEQAKLIEMVRIKQFKSLSECYYQISEQVSCIKICDLWLQLNPQCVPALLLRVKARLIHEDISEIDCLLAQNDLALAHSLNSNEPEIYKLYEKVSFKLRQCQHYRDEFQRMNNPNQSRQPVFQNQSNESDDSSDPEDFPHEFIQQLQNPNYDYDQELSYEQDPSKPIPIEVSELGKFIETRGMEMVKLYERNGQKQEAEDLREKLKKALAAKKQLEKISQLDFNRPKKKLYMLAQNFGIDLLDPSVQNEFKKIQEQNLEDIREWLKQNQWNYADKVNLQIQQEIAKQKQELARQELAKRQFKKKCKVQPKHKSRHFAKATVKPNSNNQAFQCFNTALDPNNNGLYKDGKPTNGVTTKTLIDEQEKELEDQTINCNGLINLIIFILGIIAIISTFYYSFIK